MSLLILALLATVVLPRLVPESDAGLLSLPEGSWGPALTAAIAPQIVISILAGFAGRAAVGRLKHGRGGAPHRLRVQLRSLQWAAVLSQAVAVVGFGWLALLRRWIGDLPGIDEFVGLLPAIGAIAACWWAAHPMEKILRPALARRHRYVVGELRNQLAILGVPAFLAITALESADQLADALGPGAIAGWVLVPGVAILVLLLAPVVMVAVLDTERLSSGRALDLVDRILVDNQISVRGVLIWKTGGTLLNGAVVGLLRPWRYLLLTDALVHALPSESLRAVVAHEAGHLQRRHLPWMMVIAAAVLGGSMLAAELATGLVASLFAPDPDDPLVRAVGGGEMPGEVADPLLELALPLGLAAAVAFAGFGWVSRRFERQADTFAVQYLSLVSIPREEREAAGTAGAPSIQVRSSAVLAMCRALGRVAELNGIDPAAPSWRHGSIQSRQRHLVELLGHPLMRLRIDRQISAIKLAGIVLLTVVVLAEIWRDGAIALPTSPNAERVAAAESGSSGDPVPAVRAR